MTHFKYVIIGGGLAGASAVEGIRSRDDSGSIALFSKEDCLPYDRPPLSKGLWLGKTKLEEISVHDEAFYKSNTVHLFLNSEVSEIDPKKRQLVDKHNKRYQYDKLLIATGGEPRRLSFGDGVVHYYRTVADYLTLREATSRSDEFLLIGGGFIGSELAAALRLQKKKVTLVFQGKNLLHKVFPSDLAAFVTEYYKKKGVTVCAEDVPTSADRLQGKARVTTKSGRKLVADIVIAAIGLNLHLEMAKRAGLRVDNGISVDEYLQTSDSNVYSAGDIASFPARSLDKLIRIEHWDNARAQGKLAGENMAGGRKPFAYLPYFWSDLFDLGFEAIGDLDSRLTVFIDWKEQFREGVVYYLDEGRVKGVLLWNVWEKVDAARTLISEKRTFRNPADLKGRL